MQSLGQTIRFIIERRPGLSDCELAFAIYGKRTQQLVNGECRQLESCGTLTRRKRLDGLVGNYPPNEVSHDWH
ncbi:hypothetical protein D9M68_354210 [compost metagenome]